LPSHDQLAKVLFQHFFGDLVRLAAPGTLQRLDLDQAEFVDKEAFTDWPHGGRREVDLLAKAPARDGDLRVLIHVEIEAKAGSGMAERLWQYYMQLRLRHNLLVVPILVNLKGGRAGVHRKLLAEGLEDWTAQFRYRVFSLSGCRAAEYLSAVEPLAWALAALMRRGEWTRADHRLECLQRIATGDLAPGRRWLLALWVKSYLQLKGRDLEEYRSKLALPAYREVRDMELTWKETLEQRENVGRIEGGIEALRRFVLRQMERRFGTLPESVRRKVEALDSTDSLTEVGDKLLDAGSIAEIGLGE
jgi:Domain of unknown function (DUF4351)